MPRPTIGAKLLFVLLGVGLLATLITGWQDYRHGRLALEQATYSRLTAIREGKKGQVESYFHQLRQQIGVMAENLMVAEALASFSDGAMRLSTTSPAAEQLAGLRAFYQQRYLPRLYHQGVPREIFDLYWPGEDPAALALQAIYIGPNSFGAGPRKQPPHGAAASLYSRSHGRYHGVLAGVRQKFGLHDLLLVDNHGRIVYSVLKAPDFGTSLLVGPYADTGLGAAFRTLEESREPQACILIDFSRFTPAHGAPAAFLAAPVFQGNRKLGMVIFQLSIDAINAVMNGNRRWQAEGLGATGEAFIVGSDHRMRNDSRFLLEDKERYLQRLAINNGEPRMIEEIAVHSTSILFQAVHSEAVSDGLAGRSGTRVSRDYRGEEVLSSYGPLEVDDVNWVLLAKLDASEALAPVRLLHKRLLFTSLLAALLLAGISLLLARTFTRPLRQLMDSIRQFGAGELEQRVSLRSNDEIGELATTFNRMADHLQHSMVSRDYFDNVVSSMSEILLVVSVDRAGRAVIVTVNKSACALLGYSEAELVEQPLSTLFPPADGEELLGPETMVNLERRGVRRGLETSCRTRSGATIPVLLSLSLMPSPWTGVQEVVVMAQDITPLKRVENELRQKEASLAEAQRIANMGNWDWDIRHNTLFWSDEIYRIFGLAPQEFAATYDAFLAAVHPDDRQLVVEAVNQALQEHTVYEIDHRIVWPDGTIRMVHELGEIIYDDELEPQRMIGTVQDVTEVRLAQERLRLASKVFESSNEGIIITDTEANILEVNKAFSAITGYDHGEVIGRNPRLLKSDQHEAEFYANMWREIIDRGHWEGEVWDRKKNGEIFPVWMSITAVRDEQGSTSHFAAIFADLTKKKQAESRIQLLTNYDILTGLPNKVLLRDRLQQAFIDADHHHQQVALIFLDLDDFKVVNESLGLQTGDQLLMAVAERLRSCLYDGDTLARLGGDDFAIVLPSITAPQQAATTAEKLKVALLTPFTVSGQELFVNASIGISLYPGDGTEVDTLLKNADTAMFHAKGQGKNNYQFYSADLNVTIFERLELETGLRRALERHEFELYYQPKVDLASGRMIGMEALIRWQHPDKGLVSPLKFIPLAEETGQILPIGVWTLRTACQQNQAWLAAGLPPLRVSVNLSARQLREDIVDTVRSALADSGLPPQYLELELTESMVMHDTERLTKLLFELKGLGIELSIDDFGTGYSSLSYLKRFPIDTLKIDQSFVRHLTTDQEDAAIAMAIISLARSLNLKVIAEGVETAEHAAFLQAHHCDQMQGYYFSKPLPVAEFTQLLTDNRQLRY